MSRSFTGQYHGECGVCGEQTKGTEVWFDGTNTIVHVVCPTVVPEKRGEVCASCFMEKPVTGVCETCER